MRLGTLSSSLALMVFVCLSGCGYTSSVHHNATSHLAINPTMQQIIKLDPGYKNYLMAIMRRLPAGTANLDIRQTVDIDAHDRISLYTYDRLGTAFYNESWVVNPHHHWTVLASARSEKVDASTPFTQVEMSGRTSAKQSFFAVGGVIKSEGIRAINIYFVDNTVGRVRVKPLQESYLFIRRNSLQGIEKIVAYTRYNKKVYEIGNG